MGLIDPVSFSAKCVNLRVLIEVAGGTGNLGHTSLWSHVARTLTLVRTVSHAVRSPDAINPSARSSLWEAKAHSGHRNAKGLANR